MSFKPLSSHYYLYALQAYSASKVLLQNDAYSAHTSSGPTGQSLSWFL